MIEKIQMLMKVYQLSAADLAERLGTERSGISHFLSGRNKPSLSFVVRMLEKFPEINPDWLLLGHGPMLRDDASVSHRQVESNNLVLPLEVPTDLESGHEEKRESPVVKEEEQVPYGQHDHLFQKDGKENTKPEAKSVQNESAQSQKANRIMVLFDNGTYEEYVRKTE